MMTVERAIVATKDNPLKSGIRYANALLSGIVFIVMISNKDSCLKSTYV